MKLHDGRPWLGRFVDHGLLSLVFGLILLVSGVGLGWEAGGRIIKHNDAIDTWTQETSHIAVVVADALGKQLAQVGRLMDGPATEAAEDLAAGRTGRAVAGTTLLSTASRSGLVAVVAAFGPDGAVLFTSDPSLDRRGMTVRARDFFTTLRDAGGETFISASYLSGPVFDREAPAMRILIAKRLNGSASAFAGVLVFAVDTKALVRDAVNPSVGLAARLRLFDEDGRLLAALPDHPDQIGRNFGTGLALDGSSLPRQGLAQDPIGGGNEVNALRRVGQTRFLVSAGLGEPMELSAERQIQTILLAFTALILMVVGAWLLSHAFPDERAAHGGEL